MGTGLSGSVMILLVKPIGIILLKSSGVILWAYDRLCSAAVMLPFGRITAGKPSVQLLVAYYVILFALYGMYRRFPKKIWGYMLFVSAAFLIVLCGAKTRDIEGIKITVLDVGQGDGIVLSGKGKNYLIDGGSSDVKQAGAQRIEPYLLSEGIGCLDYVFVTHGDEDHISGIRELLEGQKLGVRIDTLVLPPEEYHDEKLADLARIAVENGTRVVSVKTGANIYGRGERQTEKTIQKK
ncbi:MBL fold metallo-hydrolase [[Ruminococcus] torques]|nr:MBL fold metallo-hydrolase [[Ruminococcus] torques]